MIPTIPTITTWTSMPPGWAFLAALIPFAGPSAAVRTDPNGNTRVGLKVIGLPIEHGRVSDGVRPCMRGLGADQATFEVTCDARERAIDIEVAR